MPSSASTFQSTLPEWGATIEGAAYEVGYSFQSTLPEWGATNRLQDDGIWGVFQSTLPEWGATYMVKHKWHYQDNFNPRSPSGERRTNTLAGIRAEVEFQSTLPEWGATALWHGLAD